MDPCRQIDFVKFGDGESMVKGDFLLSDDQRIILLSKNSILSAAANAKNAGFDCTFCVAPNPNYMQVPIKFEYCFKIFSSN